MYNAASTPYAAYGSAGYAPKGAYSPKVLEAGENAPFMAGTKRKRLNLPVMWICLFVPWAVFILNFGLLTFRVHYENPALVYTIVGLTFVANVILGAFGIRSRIKRADEPVGEPSWIVFIGLTCMLAWILAVILGVCNYVLHTQPYESMMHLNTYTDIDPTRMRGQQLMDAGSVLFTNRTKVDITKSMAFKNLDTYCVAPITVPGANPAVYDFWAVGLNCCAGQEHTFGCGDITSKQARGGLRLLHATDRPFYRLAVQQAETAYGIKAAHPLFFRWVLDSESTLFGWKQEAYHQFLVGLFGYFIFQAFITVAAALAFARMGRY